MEYLFVILILVGGIIKLIYFSKNKSEDEKIEDIIKNYNNTDYKEIWSNIKTYSEKLGVNKYIPLAIMYVESKYNPKVKGDFVKDDYFGKNHYSSFGLGQIRTSKTTSKLSTFDRIYNFATWKNLVKSLTQTEKDNIVKDAIIDKGPLYDIEFNIKLMITYLSMIQDKEPLTYSKLDDIYAYAFFYNNGEYADIKDLKVFIDSPYGKQLKDIIDKIRKVVS